MWKPKLNPITRKRLQRFRSLKRSYYSLLILVVIYGISLVAELVSSSTPLVVSYEGELYFPIFNYYSEDTFTGNGLNSRPDYKEIAASPEFADAKGNWMLFPPLPYGPNEGATAETIEVSKDVTVEIKRKPVVASLDLYPDFKVRKSTAAAPLFEVQSERDVRGKLAGDVFEIPDGLRAAVGQRFANEQDLPAGEWTVAGTEGTQYELSLSAYSPRSREPRTVRLGVREVVDAAKQRSLLLSETGELLEDPHGLWRKLSETDREALSKGAVERQFTRIRPVDIELAGGAFEAAFVKEDVFFPFRPTGDHFMGLDSSGRDVFARVLYAMRISMNFGLLLVAVTMVIGVILGGLQGYFGGKLDLVGQRLIEIWESMPFLYIMILMGSIYGQSFGLLLVVYGVFNWIGISYFMRGEFLKMRKQPFVEAAHCMGLPSWKIMLRHILPNSLVPIITFFPFSLVSAIGALSALDYLGFGLPAPTPSWGELLAQAQEFRYAWWLVVYPALALFVVSLLGVFIGEGIRAAFDPRVNSRYES